MEENTNVLETTIDDATTSGAENGAIANFIVGIRGSNIYNVSSNSDSLKLKDLIEAISTIEINSIASVAEMITDTDKEQVINTINSFVTLKKEIIKNAMQIILSKLAEEGMDEETSKRILEMF